MHTSETETYDQSSLPEEQYYLDRQKHAHTRRWGSVLLLIGGIWLVFTLFNSGLGQQLGFGFVEETQRSEQIFSGSKLEINAVNDTIELVGSTDAEIHLEVIRDGFGWNSASVEQALQEADVNAQQEGDTVRITTGSRTSQFWRSADVTLLVRVPTETEINITSVNGDIEMSAIDGVGALQTTNGHVTASDLQGAFTFKTTNGELDLSNLVGDEMSVETVNGDVELDTAEVSTIRVTNNNGDLDFRNITGALIVNTISGDVDVRETYDARLELMARSGDIVVQDTENALLAVETTSGDIRFDGSLNSSGDHTVSSTSGDVNLDLPQDSDVRLEIRTGSGDLDTEFDIRESESRTFIGSIGAGEGSLRINTTSGDINIDAD